MRKTGTAASQLGLQDREVRVADSSYDDMPVYTFTPELLIKKPRKCAVHICGAVLINAVYSRFLRDPYFKPLFLVRSFSCASLPVRVAGWF
jgi:hypothetical protein